MQALLLKLMEQLNSSVFVLLGILGVLFYLIYKAGCIRTIFSQHKEKIEKFDSLSERVSEVKIKVDLIYQNTNPNKLVAAASPIAITDKGREIAGKIDADRVFKKYSGQLAAIVEKKAPQNAYDIQVQSMDVCKSGLMGLLDANEINTIKEHAFAAGLLVEDIMSIFGVLLRDHILRENGIPVADVDKHQRLI
jgi:hypothetical protein